MKTITTYFKNSNTGELIKKQEYTETRIDFPISYYNIHGKELDSDSSIEHGFVEISEKKWKISKRKK